MPRPDLPAARLLRRWGLAALLVGLGIVPARAQSVDIDLSLPAGDVLQVSDFLTFNGLDFSVSETVPGLSIRLTTDPPGAQLEVYTVVTIDVNVQIDCDRTAGRLVELQSKPFQLRGDRFITAFDLIDGAPDQIDLDKTQEDDLLQECLEDELTTLPYFPVGTYRFGIQLFDARTRTLLGRTSETLVVNFTSKEELQIELTDPPDHASVDTEFPTLTWFAGIPEATLYVYELLPHHSSPQEAIESAEAHLEAEVSGMFSYSISLEAPRRLEPGRTYLWYVEGEIESLGGPLTKRSPIWRFTVADDASAAPPPVLSQTLGPNEVRAFDRILALLAQTNPAVTLEPFLLEMIVRGETPISIGELEQILRELRRRGVQYTVRIQD